MPRSTILVPANFGVWSGPGYAGGQYRPDVPTFVRLYDENAPSYVRPVGFLDAAARHA